MLANRMVVLFLITAVGMSSSAWAGKVGRDCTYKGKRLYGKVQVVTAFPDFKVRIKDSFQDIKVRTVTSFPDSCGKWQFVTAFPDFKIQFVDAFEDFSIRYVDAFPGVN